MQTTVLQVNPDHGAVVKVSAMKQVETSVPHPIEDTVIAVTYNALERADLAKLDAEKLAKAASAAVNKRVLSARIKSAIKELRAQIKAKRDEVKEAFKPSEYALDDSRAKLGAGFDDAVLNFANRFVKRAAVKEAKNAALPEALRVQIRMAKALAKSAGLDAKVVLGQIQTMIANAKAAQASASASEAK